MIFAFSLSPQIIFLKNLLKQRIRLLYLFDQGNTNHLNFPVSYFFHHSRIKQGTGIAKI